jgi:hypothetical protein
MKKILLGFIFVLTLLLPEGVFAQVQVSYQGIEHIENFTTDIKVNTDASIDVTEQILYDFANLQRHGIYRDVPITYTTKSGGTMQLNLQDISVTDEQGQSYAFTTSYEGSDRRIKIGDADRLISGVHTYVIHYRVPRAVGFFEDFDEVYWNAVGDSWTVPITNITATIVVPFVPQAGEESQLRISCYKGSRGSTETCPHVQPVSSGSQSLITFSQQSLLSGEGLTVAVGFPKGIVQKPTPEQVFKENFVDFGWYWFFVPLLAFVLMYRLWSKKGRDPKGTGVIIPYYDAPDGLSPMQMSTLLDRDFSSGLSAEIVYLATQGYIKISHIKQTILLFKSDDYTLEKTKLADDKLKPHQLKLLDGLFGDNTVVGHTIVVSDLKYSFYKIADEVRDECEESLGEYYSGGKYVSGESWGLFAIIFIFGLFFCFFGGIFAIALTGFGGLLAYLLTVVIVCFFWFLMPQKSEKGVLTKERVEC